MEAIQFQLKDAYARLCDLLKAAGLAASGGQGRHLVAEGLVTVDTRPECCKTAKIHAGQTMECHSVKLVVRAKPA